MSCMSTVKCECSICLLLDAYVPYLNCKSSKGSRTRRHSHLSHELLTWPSIYVAVSYLFLCPYKIIGVIFRATHMKHFFVSRRSTCVYLTRHKSFGLSDPFISCCCSVCGHDVDCDVVENENENKTKALNELIGARRGYRERLLGPDQSHATAQSHGESHTPSSHDQKFPLKPTHKMTGNRTTQTATTTKVHTVMTPMSQPLGSWHMTSMTDQPRLQMTAHEQAKKTIG